MRTLRSALASGRKLVRASCKLLLLVVVRSQTPVLGKQAIFRAESPRPFEIYFMIN